MSFAALAATMVIGVNLLLRPLVQRINRQPLESVEVQNGYVVNVVCKGSAKRMYARCFCKGSASAAFTCVASTAQILKTPIASKCLPCYRQTAALTAYWNKLWVD